MLVGVNVGVDLWVLFLYFPETSSFQTLDVFCFFKFDKLICRYVNDGRPFWQYIVSSSTGCSDSQYFEELYNYYTTDKVGLL